MQGSSKKILGIVIVVLVATILAVAYVYMQPSREGSLSQNTNSQPSGIQSFQITYTKLGSFPCYNTVTTLIKDTGEVTSTRAVKNPSCVDPSNPAELTDAYVLEPAKVDAIKKQLEQTNVFSFKDSYVDDGIVDYAGDTWGFVIDGNEKELEVRVASSNDLPSHIRELLNSIRTTVFSGRYPL